jgi:hypothetical protein
VRFWQDWKLWIGTETGLPDSTLHVLGGMLLLLLGAALLRRVPWHWRAWNFVLGLEIANEVYDMLNPASGEDRLGESLHDLWLTMALPTLMVLLVPPLVRLAARREASGDGLEQSLE